MRNRVLTGINKLTGNRSEISLRVTLKEVVAYLQDELRLSKEYPNVKDGLYHHYESLKVIIKP